MLFRSLVERGHIYIAQPPLYKVKAGRDERYLKDDAEEAQYMMNLALKDATLVPQAGAAPINGSALEELVAQFNLANAVMTRLARVIDREALTAIMTGVNLSLDSQEHAEASAAALTAAINDPAVKALVTTDELSGAFGLRVERLHHGNIKVSLIDADFIDGADYKVLNNAAATFKGLLGAGAYIRRGEGDKAREIAVQDFHQAMNWLREEAERSVSKQRYKGLGEMNAEQLWETTMNPDTRRLLPVALGEFDQSFSENRFNMLMGKTEAAARRAWLEEFGNAVEADI